MKVIDLFAGCGGFSQGLKEAGHEIVLAIDNWETALRTHEWNHPESEHWLIDIKEITDLPRVDLIVGGPPCQPFSTMGKELGTKDPRGKLILDYIRLVKKCRPKYVLFENVPGIQRFPVYREVLEELNLRSRLINCADFGVAQVRRRVFASNFGFPCVTHAKNGGYNLITNKTTRKWVNARDKLEINDDRFFFLRRWSKGRNGTPIRPSSVPMWTLISGYDSDLYLCRRVTQREMKLLQGFSDDYRFRGSKADITRQIVNSVPPPIARAFGELLSSNV